jgi:lipopolysaccharide/colanic/teichoic acid biosynthesis glycosyltransferase
MFTNSKSQANNVVLSTETVPLTEEYFLYIGDTTFYYQTFRPLFINSIQVNDYSQAKKILENNKVLPELIIIDVPLNHLQLVAFKVWLRSYQCHKIPVIYNQSALAANEIKQLFSQKLVDDVVTLEKHYQKLSYKLRFINKINTNASISNSKIIDNQILTEQCRFCLGNKVLDVMISSIAIICCIPLFILIALSIKIESKGPIFYFSKRAGKGFRVFKFYKFRTMILNADKQIKELENLNQYTNDGKLPVFFKLQDDPRVTKVGAFLRKTSLDELPQLFNVLKGDMSLVGNRPLPLYEASTLTTNEWAERFMAPAGITGLWQVSKRGKEEMSNEERILLDINYARTRSLKGDLKILFQTPSALIQKTNV